MWTGNVCYEKLKKNCHLLYVSIIILDVDKMVSSMAYYGRMKLSHKSFPAFALEKKSMPFIAEVKSISN